MAHHLELEIQKNLRAGMSPEEARRQAHIAFGGVERYKQQAREARTLDWVGGLSLDFKLGIRMLVKHPALAAVGSIGMAVAIAIGCATFTVIQVVVDPAGLPVDEPDRVVSVQNIDAKANDQARRTHLHDLAVWRTDLTTVPELGAFRTVDRNLIAGDGRIESVRVAELGAAALRIARTAPYMGRAFTEADEQVDAPAVALIGYALWESRFASDPAIVGRTLQLSGTPHTIIGVMPEGFAYPVRNRVWTPLRLRPIDFSAGNAPSLDVIGRLAPGVSLERAQAEANGIAARMRADDPSGHELVSTLIGNYSRSFLDSPALVWVMHGVQVLVSLVLVIIGINVAILVYARTATRSAEIAVRTAMGASRKRVVSQLFAEALVLSTVSAILGLAASEYVLRRLDRLAEFFGGEQMPYWWHFSLSAGTVLYAAALAVLAAVIVGVVPALKATGPRLHAALKQAGGAAPLGRTWTLLIVGQVALAVAVLPIPVSTVMEWVRYGREEPEFTTHDFLTATLFLDQTALGSDDAQAPDTGPRFNELQSVLVRRLEAEPGIASVVVTSGSPTETFGNEVEVSDAGPTSPSSENAAGVPTRSTTENTAAGSTLRGAESASVDVEYFRAFGVPVRSGRDFESRDALRGSTGVLVNEAFVERVLDGGEAIGRRFRIAPRADDDGGGAPEPWLEVVGVVANFPSKPNPNDAHAIFYRAIAAGQTNSSPIGLAIRVQGGTPAAMANRLREIALSVDPMLRFGQLMPLDDWLYQQSEDQRILALALIAFCASAVLLSAAGISALMSFTVAQRRREIGSPWRSADGRSESASLWAQRGVRSSPRSSRARCGSSRTASERGCCLSC
jgi:putative ABC transport system permease protein